MLRELWSFSGRYRTLHLTWIAFFVSFVVVFNEAPLADAIKSELRLDTTQYRVMILANLALTIPFRVILGMLSDIVGPRIVFSGVLIYAALPCFAFALAQDYSQLIWSRVAIGVVGASFEVGIRMVAEWFPPKDMGFAEGIYGGWGNVGAGGAALTLPLVATAASFLVGSQGSWRYAIALTGIISAVYGVFYFFSVKDAPDGKEFQRCEHEGTIEVTTQKDFWLMTASNLPLYVALGVVAWRFSAVKLINTTGVVITCVVLLGVYLFQTYANWRVNRELMTGEKRYAPEERYEFSQVVLLDLAYLVSFGAELAVVSMIPEFYKTTFKLAPTVAAALASSYACMNLVSRPAAGYISDTRGSRKWTLVILMAVSGVGFMGMGVIGEGWALPLAIATTMFSAFGVQAAEGAVYSIVPLIKKEITGQIAGVVGAYGSVGGVAYLILFSLSPEGNIGNKILFWSIGISALIVTFLTWFLLKEPKGSKDYEESEQESPALLK